MIVSMDEFTLAVERIKLNVNLQLSNEQKLELYSYYKQATVGPCNTGKPGFFDFTGRAKWEAWHKLGSLPSDEAKMHYISLVDKHDPDWQQKPIEESTGTAGSSMGGASGTGPVVSRMAAIKDDSILHDKDKTLIDWATEGNVDRIKELIARGDDVNEPDQEGMTPLHWACDRGKVDVIKCLVDHGAKINAKDNEGQTSLHYTTSCGHRSASCYLLSNGADATSLDNDGNTPLDVCEQTIIDIFK